MGRKYNSLILSSLFGSNASDRNAGISTQEIQVFYAAATMVIPGRVFSNCQAFVQEALGAPQYTTANVLLQASMQIRVSIPDGMRKLHADTGGEYLKQFHPIGGDLTPQTKYIVIPFPKPPPRQVKDAVPICGVFFVGVVYSPSDFSARCYVLRPSMPGNPNPTTLREVLSDGTNLNLGGGCRPDTDEFISLLKRIETGEKQIYGAV